MSFSFSMRYHYLITLVSQNLLEPLYLEGFPTGETISQRTHYTFSSIDHPISFWLSPEGMDHKINEFFCGEEV